MKTGHINSKKGSKHSFQVEYVDGDGWSLAAIMSTVRTTLLHSATLSDIWDDLCRVSTAVYADHGEEFTSLDQFADWVCLGTTEKPVSKRFHLVDRTAAGKRFYSLELRHGS